MKSTIHEFKKNNLLSMSKKSIFILAIATFITGFIFTGCKSNSDKEADAIEKVQDAEDNLDVVKDDINKDAITKANDAEWQTYKEEANKTISENEARISELKNAIKKPGKTFDAAYAKSIDVLEEKNTSLKIKISEYENNQTDWESFKRELNSDMKGLGQALKDLTVNNKK
ncbi:MAG: hypothetical protein ABI549_01855 [Flavobacterium sp.]|uniref:hypothetical protein n=1 Tax=Flavobacterium sp. TaxID=239 RepID=UPI00326745FD